jgi:hypothetical protein
MLCKRRKEKTGVSDGARKDEATTTVRLAYVQRNGVGIRSGEVEARHDSDQRVREKAS